MDRKTIDRIVWCMPLKRLKNNLRMYLNKKYLIDTDYGRINSSLAIEMYPVLGKKVLVVGCGNGKDCSYFVDAGAMEVHGVDVIEGIGRKYKSKNIFYHKHTAENMYFFDDCSFDMVYCFATMEHIPNIESTFREMGRVLKRGGVVFSVAAPLWNSRYGHHKPYFENYPWIHLLLTSDEIKDWLSKNNKYNLNNNEISAHVDYMLDKTYFNMLPAKYYIDICNKLGLEIIRNDVECENENLLTDEVMEKLPKLSKAELLGITHRFIATKK